MRILLFLLFPFLSLVYGSSSFNCGQLWDYNSDSDAKVSLEKAIEDKERIGLGCIPTLINKNFYSSAHYLVNNLSQKAIYEFRQAMKNTSRHMNELGKLAKRQQTSYIERAPPIKWAQSLDEIEMEVKFSLRHGVPGCINVFDLDIQFTKDTFNLTGFCVEGGVKMKYSVDFQLWGTISTDPDETYWEELSVGEISIIMKKDPAPGRWLTLYLGDRPDNLVLWFEKHQQHAYRLDDYDGDEIYEYEGWDIENEEDDEEEDKIWNKPIVRKSQRKEKEEVVETPKPKKKKKSKKSKKAKKQAKKNKNKKKSKAGRTKKTKKTKKKK